MYHIWSRKTQEEIKEVVFDALQKNMDYGKGVLGVPASYLDEKVFNQDVAFLKDAPFIYSMTKNPNHIGCHTLGKSEHFFDGTHAIERELIEICAVDILKGQPGEQDGYVASGGTEANMQAIWIYRNYFMREHGARREEIAILCSEDSHYSMAKGANILALDMYPYPVVEETRAITIEGVSTTIEQAKLEGKRYFIVVCNMMTTMFGSVDDIEVLTTALHEYECLYKLHVDGAYGGFYYPFTEKESDLTFGNPAITSFTMDAHKMAQAPYGTGIFLIRKGYMAYANTQEASYVEGEDYTLIGSRSGANAIAVWMILVTHGPFGWDEKLLILQNRTAWFCQNLDRIGVEFYRNPKSNIVTMRADGIPVEAVDTFGLVPDNHLAPRWYKVVVMSHVAIENLSQLVGILEVES